MRLLALIGFACLLPGCAVLTLEPSHEPCCAGEPKEAFIRFIGEPVRHLSRVYSANSLEWNRRASDPSASVRSLGDAAGGLLSQARALVRADDGMRLVATLENGCHAMRGAIKHMPGLICMSFTLSRVVAGFVTTSRLASGSDLRQEWLMDQEPTP